MKKILALLLASSMLSSAALAQEVLKKVHISGTRRIEDATVMNYLRLNEGDEISSDALDEATKTLFATGLFSDVQISMKNGVAQIQVVENPIVHDVYFEGNDQLADDVLLSEVMLKPRTIYTKSKLQNDAARLLDVYKRSGRFGATVEPKIIQQDQNRVDVVFEIKEGDETVIRKINFIGNTQFSNDELKDVLITKEKAWYRFFSSTDTYDPDRLNYDKEMLRRFYLQQGFVDFEVSSMVSELTPDEKGFIITMVVNEGPRYTFEQPEIKVSLPEYQQDDSLNKLVAFKGKERFDSSAIETTISNLVDAFSNKGYAFVDVEPRFQKNADKRTVKITFEVNEGEKVYVDRIDITGNSRTLDKVVRREMKIKEGDAFNASKLRQSKTNIEDLGYFDKVNVSTNPSLSQPGKMDIAIDVNEKSTGAFNVGIGYSSYDGLLFDIGIQERNILGTGNIVGINAMVSQEEQQYMVGLTNPYFLDRKLLAGIDLFHTTRDYEDTSSYKASTTGGAVRMGWNYTDRLSQVVRYTLKQDDVKDVSENASIYIKEQQGKNMVSMIGQDLTYDKRDSRLNPTMGYYLNFGADYAGIGGDTDFFRINATAIQYFPVMDDVVLSLRADGGRIWGIGQDIRINNRYFLGDASLRGFEYGGVGARDKKTGDFLGGDWYVTASAEVTFPIGLPKEMGVKGKLFTDAGFIGAPDDVNRDDIYYNDSLRWAVGTGLVWQSPMGTIGVDFAVPVMKENYDKTKVFRLNFGKGF